MNIEDLLNSDDDIIAQAAGIFVGAKHEYEQGNLSKEQYIEIIEDAMQISRIENLTDNLNRKIQLKNAFGFLITIARGVIS